MEKLDGNELYYQAGMGIAFLKVVDKINEIIDELEARDANR